MNKPIGRCELLRTIAATITALCLLILTIETFVVGTWAIRSIHTVQTTYHPERVAGLLNSAEKTMNAVSSASFKLKSGKPVGVLDDMHRLISALENMYDVLNRVPVDGMVSESEAWRRIGSHLVDSVKKTVTDL